MIYFGLGNNFFFLWESKATIPKIDIKNLFYSAVSKILYYGNAKRQTNI